MEIFKQCADEQSAGPLQTQINRTNLICGKCLFAGMFALVTGRLTIVLLLLAAWTAGADTATEQLFADKVKPLLDSRCVSCHGPDKVKGGLRMDSRAGLLKGGDSGPALVPGNPSDSLLLQAVMHSKKDLEMPPKEKLTTNDIAVLRRWIQDGAPWPATSSNAVAAVQLKPGERIGDAWSDPRNPIVKIFGGQRLDLWSLRAVKPVAPPKSARGTHPIDAFILAKLKENKRKMSPEADRRTLARRVYFDLTGLPPTPEEVSEFVNDKRRDAYERLVDKLLASPRYGEHQARLWMDVVRYSDSNGYDWDEFRLRAWRFRDYLIRAFNTDKPFDQLIREELAGDELFDGPPKTEMEQEYLIATSYLRLGPQDNSAPLFNEQDRARAELMADLTETTSSAFLGLTMSCNRCHDHKYDPLSHADHYRMRAFFEPVKYADEMPLDVAKDQEAIRAHNKSLDEKIKPVQEQRDSLLGEVKKQLRADKVAKLDETNRMLLETPKEQRTNDLKDKIAALEKKVEPKDKEIQSALTPEQKKLSESLAKQVDELKKQKRPFTLGLLMVDNPEKIPVTKVLFQGNHKDPRAAVEPGFISALDPNPAAIQKPANTKSTGRRLTLANWIASKENPLTARVFVNRAWQQHFGQGLVATPNDFGLAGARPTHPELLDWLANEFTGSGWSVKSLHRLMVTSAAYRQSSTVGKPVTSKGKDVESVTDYSHQNIRRLSAEQLRDSLLSVSGILKLEHTGGPPIWPELPPEVLQANPAFLDDNETKTKGWYPSPKTNQNVRSLFLVQKKTVRVPFMETFDLPENSVSCARRTESIVAPQALTLLNNAVSIEAARAVASRVERAAGTNVTKQIQSAFAFTLQRPADKAEVRACTALLQQRNLTELCRALLNLNEFIYID
jgi:mono/diheme cytochrome c family protein